MQRRIAALSMSLLAGLVLAPAAFAAEWPDVKLSGGNPLPACVTPGRLMALVKLRNPNLDKRFETLAAEYKRHGEALGVRWDYVFFQMLHETGDLSFRTGARAVKAEQNNFAGLGAAKDGEPGERFADISTGVRAHIEHVMLYAGLPVDNPVAERTRKVQQWKVVKPIEGRAATFGDVFERWAPKSKPYVDAVVGAARQFDAEVCRKADPQPERVAQAPAATVPRAEPVARVEPPPAATPPAKPAEPAPKVSGADLARKAIEDGRAEGTTTRSSLGASLAKAMPPAIKILNDPNAATEPKSNVPQAGAQKPDTSRPDASRTTVATVSVPPAAMKAPEAPAAAAGQKCRVWTASYGGDRALIIRALKDGTVNFTVLDVNAGQERREAEAYIAAYAQGGKVVEAEFSNQTQALDRAFNLCPEG